MDNIKKYNLDDYAGEEVDFVIKRVEDIFELQNGIEDDPHRHHYYTLILMKEGEGTHVVDFNSFNITSHSIHLIYPGQVHQVITPKRNLGWVMNFNDSFLAQNSIYPELIDKVYLYNTAGYTPPLHLSDREFVVFEELAKQIESYNNKEVSFRYDAFGALLKLLFINISSLCALNKNPDLINAIGSNNLFTNFKKLINLEYKSLHKVGDYANKLAVSSDYLNRYVKTQSGQSAKEFIQERLVVEAKRLLIFSESSSKELAFDLGFEEPAHFNNFFKKHVGVTPGQFRQTNIKNMVKG